ncbi:inactive protein kinase SELMODRAFT_444075-like [Salvia splendens]|uniref:inactive protein kinase SELMODRAFT_444075-like n=1 Tax=Salvia splendens TaxID=180675 RepID=UPI001C26CE20|nr:inactive protein kinase SELMODRAFT_444075-like [Salvia splendens]
MTQALCSSDHEFEVKFKSLLYKIFWGLGLGLGLGCVIPRREKGEKSLDHNKAWLLAAARRRFTPLLGSACALRLNAFVLGRGALSCVFRGRVGFMRTAVAIKRLDTDDKEASKAFCRELMIASSLHNPHIVPLLGFCMDAEMGLEEEGTRLPLGLLRQSTTCIMERKDVYLAPEYFQHGKVSDKTDVYAFGVVLLELITGRKPIESSRGPGKENLVQWAKPLLQQGGVEKLLDPRLGFTPKSMSQVARMARAAAACINNEMRRPEMGEIVTILKGKESTVLTRSKTLNSGATDSRRELLQTKTEMKNHFALAMLGVELEDEDSLNRW